MPKSSKKFIELTRKKEVDFKDLIESYLLGLSYKQISKKYNISPQSVKKRLEPIIKLLNKYNKEHINFYQNNKTDLIESIQLQIIAEMADDKKIKNAPLRDLANAFEKLNQTVRLEKNLSTANIAMKQEKFVAMIEEICRENNIEQI
jgi:predicted DNA-binding protein YlxM (UPF0122 family)